MTPQAKLPQALRELMEKTGHAFVHECPKYSGYPEHMKTWVAAFTACFEHLASRGGEFPLVEISNAAIEQMKLGVAVDSAYIRGARHAHSLAQAQANAKIAVWKSRADKNGNRLADLQDAFDELQAKLAEKDEERLSLVHCYNLLEEERKRVQERFEKATIAAGSHCMEAEEKTKLAEGLVERVDELEAKAKKLLEAIHEGDSEEGHAILAMQEALAKGEG